MTTLVLEVNNQQKRALTGILKYLKVSFREQSNRQIDLRRLAEKIDYGIKEETSQAKPFDFVEDSAEYVRNLRNNQWN
jgi:hypothetical protein